MSEKIKGRFQIVDEQDNIVFMHALKEGEYDRLIRLLELLPDEQAVDDVIKSLEAPEERGCFSNSPENIQSQEFRGSID